MTLFELVKQNICVPDAAEHYGLQVNRNGMCSCPFHEDRHPSMKLNERYFYCFGCGATGDVIDLVARLFGLSSFEAVHTIRRIICRLLRRVWTVCMKSCSDLSVEFPTRGCVSCWNIIL